MREILPNAYLQGQCDRKITTTPQKDPISQLTVCCNALRETAYANLYKFILCIKIYEAKPHRLYG